MTNNTPAPRPVRGRLIRAGVATCVVASAVMAGLHLHAAAPSPTQNATGPAPAPEAAPVPTAPQATLLTGTTVRSRQETSATATVSHRNPKVPSGHVAHPVDERRTDTGRAPISTARGLESPPDLEASGPTVVRGTVVRTWVEGPGPDGAGHHHGHAEDAAVAHAAALLTSVEFPGGHVTVPTSQLEHVPTEAQVELVLGAHVAAHSSAPVDVAESGRQVLQATILTAPAATPLAGTAAAAAASHTVTMMLAVPAGMKADTTTVEQLRNQINGPVSTFWSQQTGGAVSFTVTAAHGWTALAATCADPFELWSEAAQKANFTAGNGKHLMLYIPSGGSCSYGLGTLGSSISSGGRSYVTDTIPSLIAHELGHNLGLGHSDALRCPTVSDTTRSSQGWNDGCTEVGYRDWYDLMGTSWDHMGSLSQLHADRLGVFPEHRQTVTGATRAWLEPASSLAGLRALKVIDPAGGTYFVEYRTATGQDTWLASGRTSLKAGVTVRRINPASTRASLLLDATPTGTSGDWDVVLAPGQVVRLGSGRVQVRVESTSDAAAEVAVAFDGVWPAAASADQVRLNAPTMSERNATTGHLMSFSGTGTAFEGTLLWEVTSSAGTVVAFGYTNGGANGTVGPFQFATRLPVGSYTVSVWAPDESDGESTLPARAGGASRSFTVA